MKKKLYILCMILGFLSVFGLVTMVAYYDRLSQWMKIVGFISMGYIGVTLFIYGFFQWNKSRRT